MAIRNALITATHLPTGRMVRMDYFRSFTEGKRLAALLLRSVVAAGPAANPRRIVRGYTFAEDGPRVVDYRNGRAVTGEAAMDVLDRGNLDPFILADRR
jgi:hypothetical protein